MGARSTRRAALLASRVLLAVAEPVPVITAIGVYTWLAAKSHHLASVQGLVALPSLEMEPRRIAATMVYISILAVPFQQQMQILLSLEPEVVEPEEAIMVCT